MDCIIIMEKFSWLRCSDIASDQSGKKNFGEELFSSKFVMEYLINATASAAVVFNWRSVCSCRWV